MKVNDCIIIKQNGGMYLVKLSKIDEFGITGQFKNMETGRVFYADGMWYWNDILRVEITTEKFPEPKTYLEDLKPGDKFNFVHGTHEDDVFTYLNASSILGKHTYMLNYSVYSTNENLEVTLIK